MSSFISKVREPNPSRGRAAHVFTTSDGGGPASLSRVVFRASQAATQNSGPRLEQQSTGRNNLNLKRVVRSLIWEATNVRVVFGFKVFVLQKYNVYFFFTKDYWWLM